MPNSDYSRWSEQGLIPWDDYVPRKKSKVELFFQLTLSAFIVSVWVLVSIALLSALHMVWS